MATEIGELLIRIRADMAKLEEALKKSGTQVKSFSDKVTAVGKNLTSAGMKLSLAVTAPLVLIGKKAMDAAMDVVESENLFEVSMGNMADAARNWSEEFAKSVGLNEYNVRRNVGIFNVMFDSMGIGEQKAYDMAKGLTELSYDMASFYNMDVEDAFTKLQAGITGEIEPLKRLGIVINETTVATYAYANGIAEQGAKLTEQEKIVARYGLIMEQTSKAQGDLARTLDSPANKMRIFKEQISLAMIELGQGLIPVVLKVVDIIKPYVEKFTEASEGTKKFITVLLLIAAATGPVLLVLGSLIKSIAILRTTILSLNTAIVANPIALLVIGILADVALLGVEIKKAADLIKELNSTTEDYAQAVKDLDFAIGEGVPAFDKYRKNLYGQWEELKKLAEKYPEVAEEVVNLSNRLADHELTFAETAEEAANLYQQYKDMPSAMATYDKYMQEGTGLTVEAQAAAIDYENAIAGIMAQYNFTREQAEEYYNSTEEGTGVIEDQTNAVDELRSSFNKLIDTLFDGINANNELQEAEWERAALQEKLNKLIADGDTTSQEYEQTLNDIDAADQKVIDSQYKVFTSIFTTTEQQESARQKALEYGAAMVLSGEWGEESFIALAQQFGLSGNEIIAKAGEMGVKLDEATKARLVEITADASNLYGEVGKVNKVLDDLSRRKVTIPSGISYSPGMPEKPGSGKQSGGEMDQTRYIPDLNIIGVKGEGFLTREIMNAIKTGRTDYMGVSGRSKSGSSITNNITGNVFTVREEADINKITTQITQKIYDMQKIKEMGMG